jgi:hypothetical protein
MLLIWSSLAGLDPSTKALVAAMTGAPTADRVSLINSTIKLLKATGVWPLLDVLYVMGAHDAQAASLNWKNPGTYSLAVTGSPVFTADRGYKGDGVSGYLTASGYDPSTAGLNYTQDSATAGAYIQAAPTTPSSFELAVQLGIMRLATAAAVTTLVIRANDGTGLNTAGVYGVGHFATRRSAASVRSAWKNGASINSDATASTAMGTSFNLLANSAAASPSDARLSMAYLGGSMPDAQMALLHSTMLTYLTAVGAN